MKYAMFVLVLLALPFASADLVTRGVALDASLLYYQPIPAQPGDEVDIWIQIENDGGTESRPGTLTVIDSGPFIIESESERIREFPSIPAQENFLIKGKTRISKDASEGDNTFRVRVQEEGKTTSIERDLTIRITGRDSTLNIQSAQLYPQEISPGGEARLTLVVENVGPTLIRNVDATLDLGGLSLAPVGTSNSKTIDRLPGGESYTFSFDLVSYPDAVPQAYRVPINLTYEDETGTEKSQDETIGIVIGTKPELLVYFDDIALTQDKSEGAVVVRFVNKGLAEIKLLEMRVNENEDVQVTSESSVIYVGNIDEDDYESAELEIKVSGDNPVLPLTVEYKDALNREYTENIVLPVQVKSGNGESKSNPLVMVLLLVLVAGGIWWWFKRKKKK